MSGRVSELILQLVRQAVEMALIIIIAFVTLWGFYRFRHAPRAMRVRNVGITFGLHRGWS